MTGVVTVSPRVRPTPSFGRADGLSGSTRQIVYGDIHIAAAQDATNKGLTGSSWPTVDLTGTFTVLQDLLSQQGFVVGNSFGIPSTTGGQPGQGFLVLDPVNGSGESGGSGVTDGGMIISLSSDGKMLEFRPLGPDGRALPTLTTDFKVQRMNDGNIMLFKVNNFGVNGGWLPVSPPNTFGGDVR